MEAIVTIFPRLDQLPNARLQWMITCLPERNQEGPLPRFRELNQMFQVLDATGQRVCLFKRFRADKEISARKEAAVYLLDHPEDGPRSQSQTLSGFCGHAPTVFVRFRSEGQNIIGILIEFVEAFQGPFDVNRVPIEELHKVCLVDLRFAVTDRQRQNVLTRLDDNGVLRYVPIYHGYSFFDQAPRFTILGLAW
ncbi:unnamed protein product [Arabis nemorensis]|uniref:1-phosphatidylinositol 4-kinase n=1 Tax=Arabis nemorensis TaxID=586526 RepID=A0A565CU34_9BRAS|nr:unnamed protein product [Arabis nemorensis]